MPKLSAILIAILAATGGSAAAQQPLTVVELFTSQGCSSCPPADNILGELARRDDVLALSFHVDYWNYIGWDDPFSKPAFTARQRAYARSLGLRHVYTPQIVVQGRRNVVGSDRAAVMNAIRQSEKDLRLEVKATPLADGTLRVDVAAGEGAAEVFLVAYDREHRTPVARGENGGRTLVNTHVVREFVSLGRRAAGQSESFAVPAASGERAVFVQSVEDGRILGACRL